MNHITINLSKLTHQMAGGIGANWHAIGQQCFWYEGLKFRRNRNSRGSAWGGNPPISNETAWEDIRKHALWLGFNFFRIEVDTRMFQPERRRFDFDSREMQGLYRQLQHCQEHGIDVFLTHQHQDVEWNAHAGISRVQSSPKSVPDFVHGFTKLLDQLIHKRGYDCIKYVCVSNEPGFDGCWWIGPDGKPDSVMPVVHALRQSLDRAGLGHLPISGPDWCNLRQDSADFDIESEDVGCFDGHQYGSDVDETALALWVERAKNKSYRGAQGVPFFLTEFGSWIGGNPFEDDGDPHESSLRSFDAQLVNARRVISGLNCGVDGFNRWSFTNRGDLDGQFQLVKTWDARVWEYYKKVEPEPIPYFSYGIISRFLPKRALVYSSTVVGREILAATVGREGKDGGISIFLMNTGARSESVNLTIEGAAPPKLALYQVSEKVLQTSNFKLESRKIYPLDKEPTLQLTLPGKSLSTLSSWVLTHDEAGVL